MHDPTKRHQERPFVAFVLAAPLAVLAASTPQARAADSESASDSGRYTVIEENDYFNPVHPSDRHYTQGLRLSYLTGAVKDGDVSAPLFAWFDRNLFVGEGERSQHVDWSIGQSIFTPNDLVAAKPDPRDRPYAGWAYLQGGLVQSTDKNRLDDLEVQIGVVGPAALAEQAQNDWHEYFMHQAVSNGWGSQLKNEPGLDITYERHWRYDLLGTGDGAGIDVTPDAGGALGNVLAYANAGAMLRLGYNLAANYGTSRILPAPSGGDYFDSSVTGPGGYIFVAAEGRGVGRNIFLQGNDFVSGPHVTAYPAVGDLVVGGTVFWGKWLRGTVSFDTRSKEFIGQQGPDRFTSLSLSANFDW
jgi:hypothetical protein